MRILAQMPLTPPLSQRERERWSLGTDLFGLLHVDGRFRDGHALT